MGGQPTAGPGEINHGFVDPYTLVHGLVGVVAVFLGLGFWGTLAIAISWEFVEHLAKNALPVFFPHPTQDTLANAVGDIIATMLGWTLTHAARRPRIRLGPENAR
jgi:hypothetical protein